MYYLGIDVGTTATKAIAIDRNGCCVGRGIAQYKLITDGSKIEQNPECFLQAIYSSVGQVLKTVAPIKISGISLSTQGATTAAVDEWGNPICNAYTWMDSRATEEVRILSNEPGADYIYNTTGWPLAPSLDAAKILYMKGHLGIKRHVRYLSTLEYCNLFLTGNGVIDPTNASIRNLYNLWENQWDARILRAVGIQVDTLADILPTGSLIGGVTLEAASRTGLRAGTPVFNGAHDQYCASIGSGATRKGDLLIGSGTTWALMVLSDFPMISKSGAGVGLHLIHGLYGNILSLVGAGAALQWFKDNFTENDFETLNNRVVGKAKNGPVFFPYMYGPSYPQWESGLSGAFAGIRPEHDRYDLARSVMETATFRTREAIADFIRQGCPIKRLYFAGGAAKSIQWQQILADSLNREITVVAESDSCAVGASMIAAVSLGDMPDYEACAHAFVRPAAIVRPDPNSSSRMEDKYSRYAVLCESMNAYYQKLNRCTFR